MKKLLLLSLIIVINKVQGQTIFEDASGESILIKSKELKDWFNFRANTASESFKFSYLGTIDLKNQQLDRKTESISRTRMLGADLKLNMKNGLGSVYKKGKVNTGVTLALIFGIQKENFDTKTPINTKPRSIYLKGGISYDKHTLLDTINLKKTDLNKLHPFLTAHFNRFYNWKTKAKGEYYGLFGVSFGYMHTSNINDLDDGIGADLINANGNFSISKQVEGKIGNYKDYNSFPLRLDFGIIPKFFNKNIIGFNAYTRAKFNETKTPINLGTGIFFSKDNEPSAVIGGLGWQFNNIFNKPDLLSNSSVFIYIGYTIE